MSESLLFARQTIDETEFFFKLLTEYFSNLDTDEFTNNLIAKVPQIKIGNPLADIFGDLIANGGEVDFTSSLPAIGIECQDDAPYKEYLGRNESVIVITQDFIDYLKNFKLGERIKYGEIISDNQLEKLQNTFNDYQSKSIPYKAICWDSLLSQKIQISVWADNPRITEIVYKMVRLILNRAKTLLSKQKILNFNWTAQRGVYNYDTGRNLYGSEFDITFINFIRTIEAPLQLVEPITNINVYLNQKFNDNNLSPEFNQSLNFYYIGEENGNEQ